VHVHNALQQRAGDRLEVLLLGVENYLPTERQFAAKFRKTTAIRKGIYRQLQPLDAHPKGNRCRQDASLLTGLGEIRSAAGN
jgi:hypothetical protein